ncbi:MAG: hypothetical protein WBF06_02235 [Candidatus Acidiferrales bacterium]
MNRVRKFQIAAIAGIALALAGVLLAQSGAGKQLVVNGKTTNAAVLQMDGHSYVDIDALAQIMDGSVTIGANQVVLTIPSANSNSGASPSAEPAPQAAPGLSRNFASAAISAVAEMREWTGAIGTMVTYGMAANPAWAQSYHDEVQTSLSQAAVAASTEADRDALRLLNNQFTQLAAWASGVIAERQSLNAARTMDPNALQNDAALAKITACGRFLNSMLVSGSFADNSTCD